MTFAKYEFQSLAEWLTYQAQISTTQEGSVTYNNCAVHEIGQLENGFAVDILWNDEPLESFSTKEVFPNPIGVHTFSGCEEMYLNRFCEFKPLSPYCTNEEL
jgi:hypothetical protein